MFGRCTAPDEKERPGREGIYDSGTLKVIGLACLIIAISVLLMGGLSYLIVEKESIKKLQSKDLVFIVQSIAGKIDGRISRAKETSLILARDPLLVQWVYGKEQDSWLGQQAIRKISGIAREHDYNNSFIVSAITKHYWAENGQLIDTMSEEDQDDSWFFETIASKMPVSIDIDFNKELDDTFVFVNALMGDPGQPMGVTGVGLNLKEIAGEIAGYKFGERSSMWLIDRAGKIHLAEDLEDRGKYISAFVPSLISEKITMNAGNKISISGVLEYKNQNGELNDLIYQSLQSTDWQLILQIPRSESIGYLRAIKTNTLIASTLALVFIVVIFYLISTRIADPFKRAVLLSQELEKKVHKRTSELREQNAKIMDSIDYARRLQEAVIPGDFEMSGMLRDYFVIWKPRDLVGGDFYWVKKKGDDHILAVADCTGHGVPGALMTMAVSSILNHIVDEICSDDPAAILKELNISLKAALHKKTNQVTDDGADIGICHWRDGEGLTFSGARINLYVKTAEGLRVIPGDRQSIGYQKSEADYNFCKIIVDYQEGNRFYLTTDGFLDQNGGSRDYSFGKTRFAGLIDKIGHLPMSSQKKILEDSLDGYKQKEAQRDDVTVIGFQI